MEYLCTAARIPNQPWLSKCDFRRYQFIISSLIYKLVKCLLTSLSWSIPDATRPTFPSQLLSSGASYFQVLRAPPRPLTDCLKVETFLVDAIIFTIYAIWLHLVAEHSSWGVLFWNCRCMNSLYIIDVWIRFNQPKTLLTISSTSKPLRVQTSSHTVPNTVHLQHLPLNHFIFASYFLHVHLTPINSAL